MENIFRHHFLVAYGYMLGECVRILKVPCLTLCMNCLKFGEHFPIWSIVCFRSENYKFPVFFRSFDAITRPFWDASTTTSSVCCVCIRKRAEKAFENGYAKSETAANMLNFQCYWWLEIRTSSLRFFLSTECELKGSFSAVVMFIYCFTHIHCSLVLTRVESFSTTFSF